jgi:hypothetical protein
MSEKYESVLKAAGRLSPNQRRLLEEWLRKEAKRRQSQAPSEPGKARRHFGAWDSGDERSADNDRIDQDLAREYDNSH